MKHSLLFVTLLMLVGGSAMAHDEDMEKYNDKKITTQNDEYLTGDAAAIASDEQGSSLQDREKFEEEMDADMGMHDDMDMAMDEDMGMHDDMHMDKEKAMDGDMDHTMAANAQCREIYGTIDTVDSDGDSQLGEDEFAGFYQECGIYADWDANDDEFIDEEEFSDGLFDMYDDNDDGFVSDVEWDDGHMVDDAGDDGFWDV